MAQFHHDLSAVLPMWARAHLAFKHVEHLSEVGAHNIELMPGGSPAVAVRAAAAVMRGKGFEARVKAATHFPFPVAAHRPNGSELN